MAGAVVDAYAAADEFVAQPSKRSMAEVIVGMTTSLDGFVADQSGSASRLYPDLAALQDTAYMNAAIEMPVLAWYRLPGSFIRTG